MLRIRPVCLAVAALVLGTGGLAGATATGARAAETRAADTKLCQYQAAPVGNGRYTVENDEWDSTAPECVSTDGQPEFTVTNSSITESAGGAPGAYPSIYTGCHWGSCTTGGLAAHPLPLSDLGAQRVRSTWATTEPSGSKDVYDVAYDIWINPTPTTSGAPDGTELMIWINHRGNVHPAGHEIAANVRIGGRRYDIWLNPGSGSGDGIAFEMTKTRTGVSQLNVGQLIKYCESHGYTSPSWYLISVEAGFEIWQGSAGLTTSQFSVSVTPAPRGWRTPRRKYHRTPQAKLRVRSNGQDLVADRAEGGELLRSQRVDQQLADGGDVTGGGRHHLLPALVGEDGVDRAAIAAAGLAADPALRFQPAHHVGQA